MPPKLSASRGGATVTKMASKVSFTPVTVGPSLRPAAKLSSPIQNAPPFVPSTRFANLAPPAELVQAEHGNVPYAVAGTVEPTPAGIVNAGGGSGGGGGGPDSSPAPSSSSPQSQSYAPDSAPPSSDAAPDSEPPPSSQQPMTDGAAMTGGAPLAARVPNALERMLARIGWKQLAFGAVVAAGVWWFLLRPKKNNPRRRRRRARK